MLYMLKVYAGVGILVFMMTAAVMLALLAVSEVQDYARARLAMRRISPVVRRDPVVISRLHSRNHDSDSHRAA